MGEGGGVRNLRPPTGPVNTVSNTNKWRLRSGADRDFVGGITLTTLTHQIFVKNPDCE